MRRLTTSIAVVVACILAHPEARQDTDTALGQIALAKKHYAARRLADAEAALQQGLTLLRQEQAAHALDPPPSNLPPGAPIPVGGSVADPVRIKGGKPQNLEDAMRTGAAGIVKLEFVVTKQGKVDRIRVLDGGPPLDEAARVAAKSWRYQPPKVGGQPADVIAVEAVQFTWRTDPMPAEYLDMAAFYAERKHYGHAAELLGQTVIAMQAEGGAFGSGPADGPRRVTAGAPTRGAAVIPGAVHEPLRIKHVEPVYPKHAFAAKVQGFVILETVIDAQGLVQGVRVLKSVPMLDQAAVDAVRQWRYQPGILNGVPVPVVMTVTVTFGLK